MPNSNSSGGRETGPTKSFALRRGGTLTISRDGIYVDRPDQETIRVAFENIVEVQHQSFDYFVGVLSVLLVGFGSFSLTRNVLGGLAFVAAGVVSLYVTYRNRDKFTFRVVNRPKPLSVYPEDAERVYGTLGELMIAE